MDTKSGALRKRPVRGPLKEETKSLNEDSTFEGLVFTKIFKKYSRIHEVYKNHNFDNLVEILYQPTCSKSLGIVRALFGLMMVVDVVDERDLPVIDLRYGDPMHCHFPLFDWLSPLPLEYMGLVYLVMWIGAVGISIGFKFRMSCLMFLLPYWYILLLNKTFWNNHSYLYGLISILLFFSSANHSFSVDSVLDKRLKNASVPLWNYAILRFQLFLLYFYAGLKKLDSDWIGGYSMYTLSLHWVFDPFRLVLSNGQIDFWIIHIFGFLFDLTVGFFLLMKKTRLMAIFFSIAFHGMNSRMFPIGLFPYVCMVMTPIFCDYDWPEHFLEVIKFKKAPSSPEKLHERRKVRSNDEKIGFKHRMVALLLAGYVGSQLILPYSHFVTEGYNNWTNGLYGYSWDMMVHSWDTKLIVVRVVDNTLRKEVFLDPEAWVFNNRYSAHADMVVQYAKCLQRNLQIRAMRENSSEPEPQPTFNDISIYFDVWSSLNGRFQQRVFNPKQDILKAEWSPFKKTSWLMPLLTELTPWRSKMGEIGVEVLKWSDDSSVLFVADFPGLYLEHYLGNEVSNVSLTVLKGTVILEQSNTTGDQSLSNTTLYEGEFSGITTGEFHKVYTVSSEPSCYMYTFFNFTGECYEEAEPEENIGTFKDSFLKEFHRLPELFIKSVLILRACMYKLFYDIPIAIRH